MSYYKIPSLTQLGIFYNVCVEDGLALECSCPYFQYNTNCKHLNTVNNLLDKNIDLSKVYMENDDELENYRYEQSETREGVYYEVMLDDKLKTVSCSCDGYYYHQKPCKHM